MPRVGSPPPRGRSADRGFALWRSCRTGAWKFLLTGEPGMPSVRTVPTGGIRRPGAVSRAGGCTVNRRSFFPLLLLAAAAACADTTAPSNSRLAPLVEPPMNLGTQLIPGEYIVVLNEGADV